LNNIMPSQKVTCILSTSLWMTPLFNCSWLFSPWMILPVFLGLTAVLIVWVSMPSDSCFTEFLSYTVSISREGGKQYLFSPGTNQLELVVGGCVKQGDFVNLYWIIWATTDNFSHWIVMCSTG
jgi:hypothetical protein